MRHPSRWTVLGQIIRRWWRNEPPLPPSLPEMCLIVEARKLLAEYDDMYCRRVKIQIPGYSMQAAQAVKEAGIKREPSVEGEVRTLALMLERVVAFLDEDVRRQHEIARPEYTRRR